MTIQILRRKRMNINYLQGLTFAIGDIKQTTHKDLKETIEKYGGQCITDILPLTWGKIDFIVGSTENITKLKVNNLLHKHCLTLMITEDMFKSMIGSKEIRSANN